MADAAARMAAELAMGSDSEPLTSPSHPENTGPAACPMPKAVVKAAMPAPQALCREPLRTMTVMAAGPMNMDTPNNNADTVIVGLLASI